MCKVAEQKNDLNFIATEVPDSGRRPRRRAMCWPSLHRHCRALSQLLLRIRQRNQDEARGSPAQDRAEPEQAAGTAAGSGTRSAADHRRQGQGSVQQGQEGAGWPCSRTNRHSRAPIMESRLLPPWSARLLVDAHLRLLHAEAPDPYPSAARSYLVVLDDQLLWQRAPTLAPAARLAR